jgi:phosphopantetheinyl transferase
MQAVPAYVQQPLALPGGCPAGLQLFALRLQFAAHIVSAQAQRHALRQAVDHAAQATVGLVAGALQHPPGKAPHWPQQPDWRCSIAYAWPLALWGVCAGHAWGVDAEVVLDLDDDLQQQYADVAALYLEPSEQACIASSADFAAQWCALEAQLKCAGLPLSEAASRPRGWNTALRTAPLELPSDWGRYRAALAWHGGFSIRK